MNILYIAKHGSGGNDDEGAIEFALRELGHQVWCVHESVAHHGVQGVDLVLFHKWSNFEAVKQLSERAKTVCWYFDLVGTLGDATLMSRSHQRQLYMNRVAESARYVFCTDGDWVIENRDKYPNTRIDVLRQGADSRVIVESYLRGHSQDIDILFTGIARNAGRERLRFKNHLALRYGNRFRHVVTGVHREAMRELVQRSKIVVCPHFPVTDNYWSNRVYNAAGFGGCVVHPELEQLKSQYVLGELAYYRLTESGSKFDHLDEVIDKLLSSPKIREDLSRNAAERTRLEHTYRHRVETLLEKIK